MIKLKKIYLLFHGLKVDLKKEKILLMITKEELVLINDFSIIFNKVI